MTPDEMHQMVASGSGVRLRDRDSATWPYQLRVAAWDDNAERAGPASTFVEIPDSNRTGRRLSSVQLYDSDAKRKEGLTRAGVLGAGSPVVRVFAVGAVLNYDRSVYGPLIDRQAGKQEIDVAVRLVRGTEQIFGGQPIALAIADGNSTEAVHAIGEIKLPATLPPGDYALELSAYDRLEKKPPQEVAQWVDVALIQ
jgi:hypothetical protein